MSILARPQRLIPLLAALVAFAPLSIDTYLPSLPLIARDLGAGESDVQMTISVFLAGLCLGMLGYGPLSDRFGRRRLLLGGIVLYLLATIGCIVADSSTSLILWRFLQALGGASAAVLARAIVRDLFPLAEAARVLSLMHLVTMFATLVAPLLGSLLADIAGWRAIFAALLGFALMCLLAVTLRIPETHPSDNRGRSVADAFRAYWIIATDARAIGYLLCMGLPFGGMFAFITASPFVYIELFGVSPQTYAWLFSMNIGGIIVVTWLNARLVGRLGPQRMLGFGSLVALLAGLGLLFCGSTGIGGLPAIAACLLAYVSVTGLLGANCVASLLALFPRQAGAAAGLAVAGQFAIGAGLSALVGALANGTPLPMCAVVGSAGIGCFLAFLMLRAGNARQLAEPA
ncbi:MFS family transporter [Pseudomonas sp. ATCC 13867]|uniref:Bcr/CflA family multidrug efflux MFS transporter n=1 Tax=Pseudomonas sp. ATCC 13867 TaxID=1294143 RepID=UPI0002C4E31D|nr:Bcr/CflA family multidrug efflux MFS transporter [Pseudomonas sp. ATCC 13867]AGI23681.1 MFS family transporter [Pseudomonas sp. ATCC 13867]RFQ41617.1 Bcr/CflA family drug resistance efflux transporter [Pseudomonas sp. ATCC 13867]